MKNRDLQKSKNRAKTALSDSESTIENIIDELVSEIETLEDDKDKPQSDYDDAEKTIQGLNEEIEELKNIE